MKADKLNVYITNVTSIMNLLKPVICNICTYRLKTKFTLREILQNTSVSFLV